MHSHSGLLLLSTVGIGILYGTSIAQSEERSEQDIEHCLVIIETDDGNSSGFVATLDGQKYLITNQHVLLGGANPKCRMLDGTTLPADDIEVLPNQDLARVPVTMAKVSLDVADGLPVVGEPVRVYGNSQGRGVATRVEGRVMGIGPDDIEVDAQFVSGNSGSPVIAGSGKVIGVASYVTLLRSPDDWVTEGTRFTEPRRFGIRLLPAMKWTTLTAESRTSYLNLVHDMDRFIYDVWLLFLASPEDISQDWVAGYTLNQAITTFRDRYSVEGQTRYAAHGELAVRLSKSYRSRQDSILWQKRPTDSKQMAETSKRVLADACSRAVSLIDASPPFSTVAKERLTNYKAAIQALQHIALTSQSTSLEIVSGVYYSPRNGESVDATNWLRKQVSNGRLVLEGVGGKGGLVSRDIDPGYRKVMKITYRHKGVVTTIERRDGEKVDIP